MMRPSLLLAPAALALSLAGCTQFPELEGTVAPEVQKASYPDLVPLEPILANLEPGGTDPAATSAGIEGRLGALRARANAMRGAVLSGGEKKRLEDGVERP